MNNILAAFMFFTRLPLWRLASVPAECFKRVVSYWPIVGWLTGGVTAVAFLLLCRIFPPVAAVTGAFGIRLLLTGALHEDGYADFCDGMGGGTSRECILAIMKDSHIGTYGVVGLIMYMFLLVGSLSSLPSGLTAFVIFAGDPWSKFCASQIINFLPYARKAEEAKNKTQYSRMGLWDFIAAFLAGGLPMILLPVRYWYAALAPIVVMALMMLMMKRKIAGYTGDCCGASFVVCELSFYLTATALYTLGI